MLNDNSRNGLKIILIVCLILFCSINSKILSQQQVKIIGVVLDSNTRKPVVNAKVKIERLNKVTYSDNYGEFDFEIRMGDTILILIESSGYKSIKEKIIIKDKVGQIKRTLYLAPLLDRLKSFNLNPVEVEAEKSIIINKIATPSYEISNLIIKETPIVFESDLFQSLQLLPSITRSSDYSGKLNIRGSSQYQSLILIDDVPIFNCFHFGGLTGTLNSDIVGKVNLYASCYPLEYSGAASSIVGIYSKDLPPEKMKIFGSLGLLTSSITYNNKFGNNVLLLSGRKTYFEVASKIINEQIPIDYYDLFGKYKYILDSNNFLKASIFYTRDNIDVFIGSGKTNYTINYTSPRWENILYSGVWEHYFSTDKYLNIMIYNSTYRFEFARKDDTNYHVNILDRFDLNYDNSVNQRGIKIKYNNNITNGLFIKLGVEFNNISLDYNWNDMPWMFSDVTISAYKVFIDYSPSVFKYKDNRDYISAYLQSEYDIGRNLNLTAGVRLEKPLSQDKYLISTYAVASYKHDKFKTELSFGNYFQNLIYYDDQIGSYYMNVFSLPFFPSIDDYPVSKQFQISSTIENIPKGWNITLIGFLNLKRNIQYIAEVDKLFYKYNENVYGFEINAEYNGQNTNGLISYSLGKVNRIEGNMIFPGNLDQRHSLKAMFNYKVSKKIEISAEYFFNTGAPYSEPTNFIWGNGFFLSDRDNFQIFQFESGVDLPHLPNLLFLDRNNKRMEDYSRFDLTFQYKFNVFGGILTPFVSIINLLNHKNQYLEDVKIDLHSGAVYPQKMSGLPIIPNIGVRFEY